MSTTQLWMSSIFTLRSFFRCGMQRSSASTSFVGICGMRRPEMVMRGLSKLVCIISGSVRVNVCSIAIVCTSSWFPYPNYTAGLSFAPEIFGLFFSFFNFWGFWPYPAPRSAAASMARASAPSVNSSVWVRLSMA